MAYKVIILYRLYMPSYFLGTFTEYPFVLFLLGGTAVSIILFPLEEIVVPTCGNGCFL